MEKDQKVPKYLLIVAYRGRTAEVVGFDDEAEALAAFNKSVHNANCMPGISDIAGRHLSLWEFTGRKYLVIKE